MATKNKISAREQYWHNLGFRYIGTGKQNAGKMKHQESGQLVDDIRMIDVLDKYELNATTNEKEGVFYFSDKKVKDGVPVRVGKIIDRTFFKSLKKLTEIP